MLHAYIAGVEAVAAAGFTILAARFYRTGRTLMLEELYRIATGFALLALSQALMVVAVLARDPRVATATYIASTIQAIGGLALLASSSRSSWLLALTPAVFRLFASALDWIAGVSAVLVATASRGVMRAGIAAVAASYFIRGAALAMGAMDPRVMLWALLLSEALRAGATMVLAVYYVASGGRGGQGEEEA